mgnify:CR=1 FL=1
MLASRVAELERSLEGRLHTNAEWDQLRTRADAAETHTRALDNARAVAAAAQANQAALREVIALRETEVRCLRQELASMRALVESKQHESDAEMGTVALEKSLTQAHAAFAKLDGADDGGNVQSDPLGTWTLTSWLQSVNALDIIREAIVSRLSDASDDPKLHRIFMSEVGSLGSTERPLAVLKLLAGGQTVERLSEALAEEAAQLARSGSASATLRQEESGCSVADDPPAHYSKFMDQDLGGDEQGGKFVLSFGALSDFFGGLDKLVGHASSPRREVMAAEHCDAADSAASFTASNYGTTTASRVEWWFVADPSESRLQVLPP